VERQMRRSIKMTADFWFTAWIDAGQPDLSGLLKLPTPKDEVEKQDPDLRLREHEGIANFSSPRQQFISAMWRKMSED
jgi:hypothetical protein